MKAIEDRFWSRVEMIPFHSCWEWMGGKNQKGYGDFGDNKKAHRVSYEIHRGVIPPGLVIDHLCRNRGCVNPLHLEAVSNKENLYRGLGFASKNRKKTSCKNGHPFTQENTYLNVKRNSRVCKICKTNWYENHPRKRQEN